MNYFSSSSRLINQIRRSSLLLNHHPQQLLWTSLKLEQIKLNKNKNQKFITTIQSKNENIQSSQNNENKNNENNEEEPKKKKKKKKMMIKDNTQRNLISLSLFILTGLGLITYFKNEKLKIENDKKESMKNSNQKIGKVKVGGPFELIECKDGKKFNEKDLLGKFSLIYFGFTNCPDICPEELDKMCDVINRISKDHEFKIDIQPIFISIDPRRDSKEIVKNYLNDFDCIEPLIGLIGDYESIKKTCKVYRVYFSSPDLNNSSVGDDYLVDHSIFFYLMDPNGNFVDAFGKIFNKDEVYSKVVEYLKDWDENGDRNFIN